MEPPTVASKEICKNPTKNLELKAEIPQFHARKDLSSLVRRKRSVTAAKTEGNIIFLRH